MSGSIRSRVLLAFGIVAALAALLFPFAPVEQPVVTYTWAATDGPAALPLMPYQPVALDVTTDCATARDGERTLLSTVPPRPDPSAQPLRGLVLATAEGGLQVTSAGVELGTVALPAGDCTIALHSEPARTTVLVGGTAVLDRAGDVRPDVAGAFSDADAGIGLTLVTDTRFQTTISPLKAVLAGVGGLALLGMLAGLWLHDRAACRRVALLPKRWWRPRWVDLAVAVGLGAWWFGGAVTVDDGYISGIVRGRAENGFVGNVYRWLNAPEAPFSWFEDLYHLWSLVSASTLWMRLPATLLALLCWWLLSRFALPRLTRARTAPWLAALAFSCWWVPFGLGLRPEPWVAVGMLVVFLAVERAVAVRAVLPLVVALFVAGATTAVTPGGLLAFVPLLAGLFPVVRLLRARRDLHRWPLVVALIAAPASAAFLMVYDQSLAGMLEATRVRALIGGGMEWYQEIARYAALLEPGTFQGSIGRRAAVLLTIVAALGVLWALRVGGTGLAAGPTRRLATGFLLSLAAMTVTPTKWTQHFGDLAGTGAAVLVVGLVAWSAPTLRSRLAAGLAAVTVTGALVLAGYNLWPYVGDWFTPSFSTTPPHVRDVPLATIAAVAGGLVVAWLVGRAAWRGPAAPPRWLPGPAPLVAVLLAGVLALQVGTLGRIALTHRDSYTPAADSLATLRGDPCGLQRVLDVETDPASGLLPVAGLPDVSSRTRPVDVGGSLLPGLAVTGHVRTPWYALDARQRAGELPVVVTTSGTAQPGDVLTAEFAANGAVVARSGVGVAAAQPRDVRLPTPPGADTVRLVVEAATNNPTPALVSLPRVPRLTPMQQLLPPGSEAILDWPVAFLFGCLTPAPLPLGTAALPQWRVAPPQADPAPGITYAPGFGGPFAAPRLLVAEKRMPLYLRGDTLRDPGQIYRWTPITQLAAPDPVVAGRTVTGWEQAGHARVPGLDPAG